MKEEEADVWKGELMDMDGELKRWMCLDRKMD